MNSRKLDGEESGFLNLVTSGPKHGPKAYFFRRLLPFLGFLFFTLLAVFLLAFEDHLRANLLRYSLVALFGIVAYALLLVSLRAQSFESVDESTTKPKYGVDQFITEKIRSDCSEFDKYYISTISELMSKANESDLKASMLLDRGIAFIKNGIYFYIAAVISFQIFVKVFNGNEWTWYNICGIASCTAIFIFIQFLGGWSLKQYKSFSDTSLYLIKIKLMIDKNYIMHTVAAENNFDSTYTSHLIDVLKQEITWPDTYSFQGKDKNFAKEALETMALTVKHLRQELKATNKRSRSPVR